MIAVPPEPPVAPLLVPLLAAAVQTDPDALYRAAVQDRLAGRPGEAVPKLEQVLAVRPDDVDARLNLGLALLALGRLDDAERALRRVVAQAPDYADAWVGLARVEQRRGDLEAARTLAAQALRAAPGDADALALQRALQRALAPEPAWRVDASVSHSRLSGGLPDWREARLSASRRLDEAWTVGGAIEAGERFDARDVFLEARAERRFAGGGSAYVAVGGAPDADFRPEIGVAAGGRLPLGGPLAATLDASLARYPVGTVTGLHPGLAAQLGEGRVQLSARWINVWDERDEYRSGYAVAGRWQAADRVALRLGYADAPESSDGATVDVVAWNAGADLDLTDRLVLRLGYLSEDRDAYDREEVTLGLGWRF